MKKKKKRTWKPMRSEKALDHGGEIKTDTSANVSPSKASDRNTRCVTLDRVEVETNQNVKIACIAKGRYPDRRSVGCECAPHAEEPGMAKPQAGGDHAEQNFIKGIKAVKPMSNVEDYIHEYAGSDDISWICGLEKIEDGKCAMIFHKTTAQKILASVHKIVAAGNVVHFGPTNEECFIQNIASKKKIMMKEERGVYTIKVKVLSGKREVTSSIVVDSGAAECVMPKDWYPDSQQMEEKKGVRFAGAKGQDLGNFGRTLLEFVPFHRPA
jgi:hypothetical protein